MVEILTPEKSANTTNQAFFFFSSQIASLPAHGGTCAAIYGIKGSIQNSASATYNKAIEQNI